MITLFSFACFANNSCSFLCRKIRFFSFSNIIVLLLLKIRDFIVCQITVLLVLQNTILLNL